VIERVDGTFVLETPLASMLQEGGFSLTTRGLRMRGN
jgi:ATP-dependent Lhr-like helicase